MQKTNKCGLFALILLSFFCLSAKDAYSKHDYEKMHSVFLKADKADALEKENKELKAKIGKIKELEKQIKAKDSEIEQLKVAAGKAEKANKDLVAKTQKAEEEKNRIEEEKRLVEAKSRQNQRNAKDAQEEVRGKASHIGTLEGEKKKLEEQLAAANTKIEELEKQGMADDKTEPTYKSTVSPFMLFLQVLTLLCSICAIVLLIKNSLTIKDFSETHWRD